MANRRMFSLKIVDTDAFLEMPQSSQLLYFHLAMRADDDGFVANPKKVMRMIGSQDDDFKVLLAKRFILTFESGICVIKHWLIHNLIRVDRYSETQWIKEKQMLVIDEKTKKYSIDKEKYPVIPNGNQMQPQVRLGKVRLGKASSKEEGNEVPVKKERNKEIDELHDFLKETLGLKILDGSAQTNRRFCYLALKKFGKDNLKNVILAASQNDFWKNKITDFKGLYYSGVKIASSTKDKPKQSWAII